MRATDKQRRTLDTMQIQYDEEITVERASELIAAYIEKRRQLVEEFKRTHTIDQVVEQYGNQQVGRDHKIFAPWRAESTPSVHIYEDGSWHDYGAGSWKADWARFFTHIRDIYLLFDNDKAGQVGASKVHATMRRARIVTLPEGIKDIGELWAAGYAASWLKENIG